MKALILAAGRGSRMENHTEEKPKCLVDVNGQTLLSMQVASLRAAGINQIGLVTGYKAHLLDGFADKTFHNADWANTNMVHSLTMASSWLEAGPCIVSYSDIFYEPAAVSALINETAALSLTYDPNWAELWSARFEDPLSDAETFQLDSDNWLTDIGRRPETIEMVEGQYMGLLKFTPTTWEAMRKMLDELPAAARDKLDMTSALRALIQAGSRIKGVEYRGRWGEVDTSSDLAYYKEQFSSRR